MIRYLKRYFACRKLARMVESNRSSFSTQDYVRRRNAMLRHTRKLADC